MVRILLHSSGNAPHWNWPDRADIASDGSDLCYILVEAVNAKRNPCPLADAMVSFKLNGPAVIAGIDNGNPLSMQPFQSPQHSLFHGKAMLILQSIDAKPGSVNVTASADGYESARIRIPTINKTNEQARP